MLSNNQIFDSKGDITLVFYDEPEEGNDDGGNEEGIEEDFREIRMLVSSRHLILASPVFEAMLSDRFQEGQELLTTGSVTIPLPDDCPCAFAILMTLVHAKYNLLPKSVSLETLTNLAVLVDKYQVHDSVGPSIIDQWINELELANALECVQVPTSTVLNDNTMQWIMQWISISWVFRRQEEFMSYTKLALLNSTNNISAMLPEEVLDNLPIPEKIIDTINHRRLMYLNMIFHELSEAVEWLKCLRNNVCMAPIPYLRENCRTRSLSSFTNNPAIQGLLPPPKEPCGGLSICNVKPKLECIHVETFCGDGAHMSYLKNGKGGWGYFAAFAEEIFQEEKGLSFQDFV